jgi:hypothetical protein
MKAVVEFMHKTARGNRREKKGVGERARPVKREGENKIYMGETFLHLVTSTRAQNKKKVGRESKTH